MMYIENIFICISIPLLLSLIFIQGEARKYTLFVCIGMGICVLSAYVSSFFMGYYGGWNHDPRELTEQQENILNTFQNKDEFIVVGTRPMDGTVTSEALDEVLSQKWGEHYISLASVTSQPASTKEAQQTMAEAILQKLEELGYISKN